MEGLLEGFSFLVALGALPSAWAQVSGMFEGGVYQLSYTVYAPKLGAGRVRIRVRLGPGMGIGLGFSGMDPLR